MFYAIFIHKDYSELFLSAHFLFWEILNLHLTFAVHVKLKLTIGNSKGPHHCLEKVGTGSTPTSNITWVGHSKLMKQSNGGTKWRLCPGLLLIKTLRVTLASHLFKASNFIWPLYVTALLVWRKVLLLSFFSQPIPWGLEYACPFGKFQKIWPDCDWRQCNFSTLFSRFSLFGYTLWRFFLASRDQILLL